MKNFVEGIIIQQIDTMGAEVEVVTDHKPLIPIYNEQAKPKQLRVNNHKTKLLLFNYNMICQPGKLTTCDYCSRHPPKKSFTQEETDEWALRKGWTFLSIDSLKKIFQKQ